MNEVKFSDLRRIVLDSYLFYSRMKFPTNDIVTPLADYLSEQYGLNKDDADSLAVNISIRASGLNGSRILELRDSRNNFGYFLLEKYNLRDVVRNAINELKEVNQKKYLKKENPNFSFKFKD